VSLCILCYLLETVKYCSWLGQGEQAASCKSQISKIFGYVSKGDKFRLKFHNKWLQGNTALANILWIGVLLQAQLRRFSLSELIGRNIRLLLVEWTSWKMLIINATILWHS
jgi:hypothetical protein